MSPAAGPAPTSTFPSTADDVPRWRKGAVLATAAFLYVIGTIGSNLGPAWVDERPLVVLLLSARNRNLFASVPFIDPLPYALVGFAKVTFVGVVLYFVGRWFGHRFLEWTAKQLGELPAIYRWFQKGIDSAGWLLVLAMPGSNLVCMMAGHRRMSMRLFLAMLSIGTVIKLVVLWIGGKIFENQIRSFLDAIEKYQWWIVGGLFLITFVQSGRKARGAVAAAAEEIRQPE